MNICANSTNAGSNALPLFRSADSTESVETGERSKHTREKGENMKKVINLNHVGELSPVGNQKSFYKKANVYADGFGNFYLKSYDTFVAVATESGNVYRLWHGWSATTSKHIDSFAKTYAGFAAGIGKRAWLEMPVASILKHDEICGCEFVTYEERRN